MVLNRTIKSYQIYNLTLDRINKIHTAVHTAIKFLTAENIKAIKI